MPFTISANDRAERIIITRTTPGGALSRAEELERHGMESVRITDADGRVYTTLEFRQRPKAPA